MSKDVRYLHMCVCTTCVASVVVALHALIHSRARVCVMILSVVRYTSNQACICECALSSFATNTPPKTLCRQGVCRRVQLTVVQTDASGPRTCTLKMRTASSRYCLTSFIEARCPCVSVHHREVDLPVCGLRAYPPSSVGSEYERLSP